jgi:hypothetical protein
MHGIAGSPRPVTAAAIVASVVVAIREGDPHRPLGCRLSGRRGRRRNLPPRA